MDLLKLGAELIGEKLGVSLDSAELSGALARLLGDGNQIDFAGLAGKMASSGQLQDILGSWLGDGENAAISAEGILDMLGGDKVAEFAGAVGTDTSSAAEGLSEVIPQLVDKASSGGNLLESFGGVGGLIGAASSLFKR